MDYLYFDGQCPVCRKEMALLRRWKNDDLKLVDIHTLLDGMDNMPSQETLLRVLHLWTGDGRWLRGVEASVAAWRHTTLGGLWAPLLWPPFRGIVERVYRCWAARRFDRLYGHCAVDTGKDRRRP